MRRESIKEIFLSAKTSRQRARVWAKILPTAAAAAAGKLLCTVLVLRSSQCVQYTYTHIVYYVQYVQNNMTTLLCEIYLVYMCEFEALLYFTDWGQKSHGCYVAYFAGSALALTAFASFFCCSCRRFLISNAWSPPSSSRRVDTCHGLI